MRNDRRLTHCPLTPSGLLAGKPSLAVAPLQSPPPRSAGPLFWCRKSGSAVSRSPPVIGSFCIVSPVPMITQPCSSTALVKKSPRRRSSPVATQVVPDWQMLLCEIGRPTASAVVSDGDPVSAPVTVADRTEMSASWQARSTTLSVWYQTTLTLPLSPAVIHGQKTRLPAGAAIVCGVDQVAPKSGE